MVVPVLVLHILLYIHHLYYFVFDIHHKYNIMFDIHHRYY